MKIEIVNKIPIDIGKKMRKDWKNYDDSHGIDLNFNRFNMIMRDDNSEVIGLLSADTIFAEIYVDEMWVDSSHRKKGYGHKLLNELECRFEEKGYWNINLCTSDFQAPEFYKKCGFELEFVRKNFKHPKLTKYFFIKYFKNEIQNQGIL